MDNLEAPIYFKEQDLFEEIIKDNKSKTYEKPLLER